MTRYEAPLPTDSLVRRCQHPDEYTDDEVHWAFPGQDRTELGDTLCGIACVHMITQFVRGIAPDYLGLVRAGIDSGALGEHGWIHSGLGEILTALGVPARPTGSHSRDQLVDACERGLPSIVSCSITFPEDGSRGGHLVVLLGERQSASGARTVFADPSRWGATHRSVESQRFWSSWSGRAVVLDAA